MGHLRAICGGDVRRRDAIGRAYEELAAYMEDRRSDFVRRSSVVEFEWAMRQVPSGQAAHELSCSAVERRGRRHPRPRDGGQPRHGFSMIICPGRKAIVWAHNAHVSRAPFTMPDASRDAVDVIDHLSDRLGDDLVSIAGDLSQRRVRLDRGVDPRAVAPTDTTYLGGALAQAGEELMLLDLRSARPGQPCGGRGSAGNAGCGDRAWTWSVSRADAYDAVYFVRTITRTERGSRQPHDSDSGTRVRRRGACRAVTRADGGWPSRIKRRHDQKALPVPLRLTDPMRSRARQKRCALPCPDLR